MQNAIFGDIHLKFKRDFSSVVTWLNCVYKHASHTYNNLYPVKTENILYEKKKNLTLSLCLSFSNFVLVIL